MHFYSKHAILINEVVTSVIEHTPFYFIHLLIIYVLFPKIHYNNNIQIVLHNINKWIIGFCTLVWNSDTKTTFFRHLFIQFNFGRTVHFTSYLANGTKPISKVNNIWVHYNKTTQVNAYYIWGLVLLYSVFIIFSSFE